MSGFNGVAETPERDMFQLQKGDKDAKPVDHQSDRLIACNITS